MALHDFALDGVIKARVSSDGFPVTTPAGVEPVKSGPLLTQAPGRVVSSVTGATFRHSGCHLREEVE